MPTDLKEVDGKLKETFDEVTRVFKTGYSTLESKLEAGEVMARLAASIVLVQKEMRAQKSAKPQ